jgi:hypothetical protein
MYTQSQPRLYFCKQCQLGPVIATSNLDHVDRIRITATRDGEVAIVSDFTEALSSTILQDVGYP